MARLYSQDTSVCSYGEKENLPIRTKDGVMITGEPETKDYGKRLKNIEADIRKIPFTLSTETEKRKLYEKALEILEE